jgi:uncharacterized protein
MPLTQWRVRPAISASAEGIWVGPGAAHAADGLWLGTLAEAVTGRTPPVWLTTAKESVVGLFGKRGSGKSFTLGVMAEGLSLRTSAEHVARQSRARATLLFDPLDVYWSTRFPVSPAANAEARRHYDIARGARLSGLEFDVEAWLPGAFSRRPEDPAWFKVLQLSVSSMGLDEWGALLEVNVVNEPIGQALTDALQLASRTGFSSARGEPVSARSDFGIPEIIRACDSQELAHAYHPETLRALRQRLASMEATGLFAAGGQSIGQVIAPGRLSVILLGRLPSAYQGAIAALLTRLLIEARSRVTFAEKRLALEPNLSDEDQARLQLAVRSGVPRTTVALDEAQNFLAPSGESVARSIFIKLVKEGRNIGLSAIVATQQPSALDRRILSQVEVFLSHQLVTDPDIQVVRDNLKSAIPDSIEFGPQSLSFGELLRTLAPGQCVISAADMNTTVRRCVAVTIRPRATVHGGIEL